MDNSKVLFYSDRVESYQIGDVSLPFDSILDGHADIIGVNMEGSENDIIIFDDDEDYKIQSPEDNVIKQESCSPLFVKETSQITIIKQEQVFVVNKVDFEGQFLKKSHHKLQGNQYYDCTLQKFVFKYYQRKNKNIPQGILDFETQEYEFEVQLDKQGRVSSFLATGCHKIFEFLVVDIHDVRNNEWTDLIRNYVRYSMGGKRHLQGLALSHRFWRHNRISDDDVFKSAQTGDLLIFRSKGVLPSMQRSITGNHIVMFLKHPKQLMVLESSNQYGVIEFSYAKFVQVRSYSHYEKILFKKLNGVDQSIRDEMLQLAAKQIGKGYSLSPMKLLRESKRKRFFCSELVAYLYQLIGILPTNVKACTYLPGHFTDEKKPIKLDKNATLSEDYLIDYYNY